MKYVLGLSYTYKKFKKNSIIRLYNEDILLDDITLDRDCNTITKTRSEADKGKLSRQPAEIPERLHIIELEGSGIGDYIDLFYENHDNNYTNGFMTKFSYIKLHDIFLLPKCCLDKKISLRLFMNDNLSDEYNLNSDKPLWPTAYDAMTVDSKNTHLTNLHMKIYHHKIGGTMHVRLPVIKKHGIKMFVDRQKCRGKFRTHRWTYIILHYFKLLNTYNENK